MSNNRNSSYVTGWHFHLDSPVKMQIDRIRTERGEAIWSKSWRTNDMNAHTKKSVIPLALLTWPSVSGAKEAGLSGQPSKVGWIQFLGQSCPQPLILTSTHKIHIDLPPTLTTVCSPWQNTPKGSAPAAPSGSITQRLGENSCCPVMGMYSWMNSWHVGHTSAKVAVVYPIGYLGIQMCSWCHTNGRLLTQMRAFIQQHQFPQSMYCICSYLQNNFIRISRSSLNIVLQTQLITKQQCILLYETFLYINTNRLTVNVYYKLVICSLLTFLCSKSCSVQTWGANCTSVWVVLEPKISTASASVHQRVRASEPQSSQIVWQYISFKGPWLLYGYDRVICWVKPGWIKPGVRIASV